MWVSIVTEVFRICWYGRYGWISTAYVIITLITLTVYIIIIFLSLFLDFNKLFNTSENIKPVFFILLTV